MPNGSRGCYVDGEQSHRYGTYLTEELPLALGNWFHLSPRREDTFIAGMSMGGYGALRAAMAHPERYAAAAGLSTAVRLDQMRDLPRAAERGLAIPPLEEVDRNFRCIFGPENAYESSPYSLKALARQLNDASGPKPRLLQLCGDDDPLLPANEDLAAFFADHCPNLDHTFQIDPGMHNFDYWDQAIRTVLTFFGLPHT